MGIGLPMFVKLQPYPPINGDIKKWIVETF